MATPYRTSLPRRDRRLRAVWVLRCGIAAEGRRRVRRYRHSDRHAGDAAHPMGFGALRRRARPPQNQVDQQAIRKNRRGPAVPVFRQCGGGKAHQRSRTRRALRRRDLCGGDAIGSVVEHSRRGPAGQHRRRRFCGLVQRSPAPPGHDDRPVGCPCSCHRQRQRRTRRRPHPGDRPKRARAHRHRRPRAGIAAPTQRRGSGGHRSARAAADRVHHAGVA